MSDEIITQHSVCKLALALSKAQAEFVPVPKTKTAKVRIKAEKGGGEYVYHYADLADILKMALPILGKHELAFSQPLKREGAKLFVASRLIHSSGETLESAGLSLPENLSPQEFGSALTYYRRYDGCTLLGIAPDEDNDGKLPQAKAEKRGSKPVESDAAPDGLPAVKCEDCGAKVIGYSGPDGPVSMGQALAHSRHKWEKDLCGGCQIKWARKEKTADHPISEPELVEMDGELRALGVITQLYNTKNSFSFRLGPSLLFSCWHKSQIAALTTAMKKPVEIVYSQTKDGKYRNVERIVAIDGQAFAAPLEIQEHETAVR